MVVCFSTTAASLRVVVGEHNLRSRSGLEVNYRVSLIILHEGWGQQGSGNDNDIGELLFVASPSL